MLHDFKNRLRRKKMNSSTFAYIFDAMNQALNILDDLSNPDFERQRKKLDKAIDEFYSWYHKKGK